MKRAIQEKRKTDPLIGAKVGSQAVFHQMLQWLKDERGVHTESLFTVLGALAGYSCQAANREELVKKQGVPEEEIFMVVDDNQGNRYFLGDSINKPLAEVQLSVWALAAGAAQSIGAQQLIDLHEVFAHSAKTVGGPDFGVLRVPPQHKPKAPPRVMLEKFWPACHQYLDLYCESAVEWPILYGLAIQHAMIAAKGSFDPNLALRIVMESAVSMSKVDLRLDKAA
jgi:hypothetical protein